MQNSGKQEMNSQWQHISNHDPKALQRATVVTVFLQSPLPPERLLHRTDSEIT